MEELYLASNGIDDEGLTNHTGLSLFFEQLSVLDLSKVSVTSRKATFREGSF